MDPVTAFGLAAGVLQFIQFSNELLTRSVKIYKESKPSSSERDSLELDAKDCKDLVGKLEHLRAKSRHERGWNSFREALRDSFGQKDNSFRQLQDRLKAYESSMSLHMCAIIIENGKSLLTDVERISIDYRSSASKHSERLKDMETQISHILDEFRRFNAASRPYTDTETQLVTQLKSLSLESVDVRQTRQILHSLQYDQRPVRHENIAEAHQETFEWAMNRPSTQDSTEDDGRMAGQGGILEWLRSGNGVFWVSGKPGSGKSTLMKFLADHHGTRHALALWAAPQPVILATHYFWSPGTEMQKSEKGLWQSLLLDILNQAPELTSEVCNKRWNHPLRSRTRSVDNGTAWSVEELRDCLQQIAEQPTMRFRLCIFLDGLDEYEGDHLDMARTLIKLSRSPIMKLCVSSRALNVFERTFGISTSSKIYMQKLTQGDILSFTRSRLGEHPLWSDTVPPDEGETLVRRITTRAEGVFLWVFLVTKLLREGLTNDDTIEELQVMLESFPPELEPFYKHILDSVPSVYHCKMSGFLRLALDAEPDYPFNLRVYYFHEMEYKDVDFAVKETVAPFDNAQYDRIRGHMVVRFDAICKGLLEIDSYDSVGFIHHIVRDWLATTSMKSYLEGKARPDFNTTLAVLRATLAWLKHPEFPLEDAGAWSLLRGHYLPVQISLLHDHACQQISDTHKVLDGLFSTAAARMAPANESMGRTLDSQFLLTQSWFIYYGFWDYLQTQLMGNPGYLKALSKNPRYVLDTRGKYWPGRAHVTSAREAEIRSRVTTSILGSMIQHCITPFSRLSIQNGRKSQPDVDAQDILKLSNDLLSTLDADPSTIRIPTIMSTKAEIQAWTGLFFCLSQRIRTVEMVMKIIMRHFCKLLVLEC